MLCFQLLNTERCSLLYCSIRRGNRVTVRAPCEKKKSRLWGLAAHLAIQSARLHSCRLWEFSRSRATLQLSHACCFGVCPLPVAAPSPSFSPLCPVTPPAPFSPPAFPSSLALVCCTVDCGEGGGPGGGISRLLGFLFFRGGGYLEDGARCYGVSAEIQSILLLKIKFCCLVIKHWQAEVLLGDVFGC